MPTIRRPVAPCSSGPSQAPARTAVQGFSLVELLVAATLALVVMGSLASLFSIFARGFNDSKEIVEMSNALRSASWRLRQDLLGLTADVKPWVRPEANAGYFEIVEGGAAEQDMLMFTTASTGRPFAGRLAGVTGFEAPVAEVAWFCRQDATSGNLNLYRRQLLVAAVPAAGPFAAAPSTSFSSWDAFFQANDLSVRLESGVLVPNSLADLTRREHRFLHNPAGTVSAAAFPYRASAAAAGAIYTGDREGEDIVLANVRTFEVRVYDPSAQAYVNLTGTPATKSKLTVPTWDTWSMHYEFNGIDEDGAGGVDQGTNGRDDNGDGAIDDAAELETSPPIVAPIRGLQIRMECIDPSTQETRQVTVQHSFQAR